MRERLEVPFGPVSAIRHEPPAPTGVRCVLTHGAGGTMETPSLAHLANALAERGIETIRFNLPAAEQGKRRPDPAARAEAVWEAVAGQMRSGCDRLIAGGRSFGGRMATHVAARSPGFCDGLLLLAYPLHRPGEPAQLRAAHLPDITVPMLVVQGDRDPFASGTTLDDVFGALPNAAVHRIEGADHAHAVRGRSLADVAAEVAGSVVEWLAATDGP